MTEDKNLTNMELKNIYCRLCAELYPDYLLLEIEGDKAIHMNLSNKILNCYNVKITADEILPKHVCSNCFDKVIDAFEFHELVHKSQEFLIKRVNVDDNVKYVEIEQENIDNDASTKCVKNNNLSLKDDNYNYDFLVNTKIENFENSNSEDEKNISENKSSLEDSQKILSSKQIYILDGDDEYKVKGEV